MNCRKLFSLAFAAILILSLLPSVGLTQDKDVPQLSDKIDKELADLLSVNSSADFIITMAEQADLSAAYEIRDWNARGQFVYDTLRAVAERSQASAKDYSEKQGLRTQTFIAGNELYVYAGDLNVANTLAELPEVAFIRAPRTYTIDPIISDDPAPAAIVDWGITDTKADQFWAQFGYKGEGIVVSNIDTGVQWNHPALVNQFKCPGDPTNPACWSDPSNICGGSMCDNNGHGTHTMGTMVSKDDPSLTYIAGMAPNAQWIACKGCESSSCSTAALNACADWIVAPNGDPANRPHIVNNSWGGGGGDPWYQAKVQAWRAAGIFPAFSAGNSTGCGSLGTPGDYQESFGTTGHNSSRAHVYAQGPSDFGHDPYTKPNITAPASSVCSTVPTDSWSCAYSGTSMASPHSAGAVALLWSCNPSLIGQIDATFEALQNTADAPDPASPTCGVPPDGEGTYEDGYGYLNVLQAGIYNCVASWGGLDGHAYTASKAPIEGATITGYRDIGGQWSDTTDATGYYSMTVGTGVYTVTAEHPLYATVVATGIGVVTDTVTTHDFYMAPKGLLFGYVTDFNSGAPLEATVTVEGVDVVPTDPATGYYSLYLDAGTYDVKAEATDYASQTVSVNIVSGVSTQQDFALLAAIAVVPDPIAITLELGQTGSVGSVITNNMVANYPFEFREFPLGAAAKSGSPEGSGGPDPFGYTYVDSDEAGGARYEWIDATDGTPLGLADDGEANVTLPFAFTFYGTSSTDIRVGNNGGFIFNATTGELSTANADLGTTTASNLVVPFWDDIDSDTGDVYYKTVGTAPARMFVIEWYNRPHYTNVGSGTFELILYEGTNNIKYQYLDTDFGNASYDYGVSATSGIRETGSNYLQYSYNQAVLVDGLAICFQYPDSPPCDGGDVPWFGTSIVSGTVPAGDSLTWTNLFSATTAAGIGQPGEYNARLGIYPTSAGLPSKQLSVVMTVLPSANFGMLQGTVTSDRPGGPLEAGVLIEATGGTTVALTTDPATGYYFYWLEQGTYDVTASAPDYVAETVTVQVTGLATTTQDFELALYAPEIVVNPLSLEKTLEFGQVDTSNLNIANDGLLPLDYEIIEMPGGLAVQGSGGVVPHASGGPDPFGYTYVDSNEAGGARYEWIDATDGTPLGLVNDGEASVTLPFTFTFYGTSSTALRVGNNGGFIFNATTGDVWAGNANLGTTTYNNLVVPFWDDIDDDTGNVYYKTVGTAPNRQFIVEWFDRPHSSNVGSGTFELILYEGTNNIKYQYLDTNFGNASYDYGVSATSGIREAGSNYLQYSFNQAVLVDGLAICFQYPGSPPCDGGDVPWLAEDPISGTVPIAGNLDVLVTFDAGAVVEPGVYTARLLVNHNDPLNGIVQVPVTMTVLPTADLGKIEGVVTSDRPGGPLEALITIDAGGGVTWTVPTDPATGYYYRWLNAGTYDVTASADGYVPETVPVQITGQQTTTQDFQLALIAPDIVVTPLSLEKTLEFGQVDTSNLNIANNGLAPLDFEVLEVPSGLIIQGSGGPDPFGYTYQDSNEPGGPLYEWIDATDGTALGLSDDGEANVTLPFAFDFYGTSSTAIRVGNNGGFIFNATAGDLSNVNAALATTTASNIVVPFWDDVDADTGNVYYKTVGTAPDRQFVVEWFDRPHFSNVGSGTFELILYEGTNNIKYQYLDTNFGNASYDYGVSATSGIREAGSNYLQYSFNQAVLVDGLAICFQYPGSPPCDGGDVPWLAEDPISGTVPIAGNLDVLVTFDAGAVVEPGVYTARLLVSNNDPFNGLVQVPVTLTVLPTGSLGRLDGTVTSDRPGGPLEADILIEASGGVTWTVTSDPATGYYYRWLNAGTYTVTASAAGYVPETVPVQITGQQTTTQDFQLALYAPEIVVAPLSLEQTLEFGQTADQALDIANIGLAPLDFEVREQGGALVPPGLQANTILLMGDDLTTANWDTYRTALAEAGVAWDEWDLLTQPFPTAAELVPYDTLIWTDDSTIDPGDADCQVVADWLVSGDKSLLGAGRDFIWDMANGTPGAGEYNLYLLFNTAYLGDYAGTTITTLDGVAGDPIGGDFAPPNGLTLAGTLDSNGDYADENSAAPTGLVYGSGGTGSGHAGLTHYEGANYKTVWLGVNFHDGLTDQDQRNLLMENILGFLVGLDVPWLSEEPISGTVPVNDSVPVQVTFDSGAVAEPGVYLAKLNILSNDPFNSPVRVPVTMTVLPGANLGRLDGVVTGTGYCGGESYPLGASLVIEASDGVTRTVATNPANGYYYRWLTSGTYTVTVAAPEHVDGAAVVQITGQQTTTQDFSLRYIESCMDVTPTSFSLTLPVDTQRTELLTIDNLGAGELIWELHETTRTLGIVSIPRFEGTLPDDKTPSSFLRDPNRPALPAGGQGGLPLLNPGAPGYGMDLFDDSLYYWPDVDIPGAWNLIGTPGVTSAYAGDFAGSDFSKVYLISDDTLSLYAVDTATAAATLIGPCTPVAGQTWTGMAWDPTSNTMYGSATDGATATLFTINLATGTATQVATISGAPYTIGIAVDGSGQMYGVDVSLDSLILIDKATGATTVVGSIGFNANYAQGMDYDLDNNILYLAGYNGSTSTGSMYIVDTTTGAAAFLGDFPGGDEVDALAIEAGGVPPWGDIPWVTEVPTNGVVPPDSFFDVNVTFDATGLTVGECYTGSLGLLHDDPGWDNPAYVPLTLCVAEACEEVAGVDLSVVTPGPFYPGAIVEFSADIAPDGFTGLYNYSINGGPAQVAGDDPLLFSLTFADPGTFVVEIAVWNCDMTTPVIDTVEVVVSSYTIYLPVIFRDYP